VISSRAMSGAPLRRSNARAGRFRSALPVAGLIVLTVACTGESRGRRILGRATPLYEQGRYAEALPLFQQARDAGLQDGVLLYQLGFCREAVDGKPEGRRETWKEAEPLLVREIGQPDGATLERLYDLAVIHSDRQEWDAMNQYARQAIEQYEKGPDPNALTGQDWFRLGRLHDLVNEFSESEAAYRRSVSAFAKTQGGGAIYRSLALAKVAELDLQMARYPVAAERFDEALKLFPANSQVRPFLHGLALLGAHRYEEATKRFAADTSETNTESQYGADLARKARDVAPLDDKDIDGIPLETIPMDVLQERLLLAAKDYRSARDKNSYRPGDPLPAEVALYQKRFAALTGEYFMRTRAMQDFCMEKGIADLVRR
jgi:tetratricopeptide (TPR) repeat protein